MPGDEIVIADDTVTGFVGPCDQIYLLLVMTSLTVKFYFSTVKSDDNIAVFTWSLRMIIIIVVCAKTLPQIYRMTCDTLVTRFAS